MAIGFVQLQTPTVRLANGWALRGFGGEFARVTQTYVGQPRPHPNLAELYRKKVSKLQDALADPSAHGKALEILRGMIEHVSVKTTENGVEIKPCRRNCQYGAPLRRVERPGKGALPKFGKAGCGGRI